MDLTRTFDPTVLNDIVNDPSVRPWIVPGSSTEPLDLAPLVGDWRNVVLHNGTKHAAILAHWQEPGIYEIHTQALPQARGAPLVDFVHAVLHWLYTRTEALELQTKVPEGNKAALGLVRSIHGRKRFERPDGWLDAHDVPMPCSYWSLSWWDWLGTSPLIAARGEWFHDKLENLKALHGSPAPVHAPDLAHNRAVGATVDMILAGQLDKGVALYNRWARFAGYAPLVLLSHAPTVIDIHEATLLVRDGDFEIIQTRRP